MSVLLPEKLRQQLARIARRFNRSANDIVRESVRRFIVTEQLRMARQAVRLRARAQGYLTDEDVFKNVS